jgi:hypothetical protein
VIFFVVPLFLSVALGMSAAATGVRLRPLSLMLLLFAVGVPKLLPNVSPQRVIRLGFVSLFAGLVLLVALLDFRAGAEIRHLAAAARRRLATASARSPWPFWRYSRSPCRSRGAFRGCNPAPNPSPAHRRHSPPSGHPVSVHATR